MNTLKTLLATLGLAAALVAPALGTASTAEAQCSRSYNCGNWTPPRTEGQRRYEARHGEQSDSHRDRGTGQYDNGSRDRRVNDQNRGRSREM